MNSKLKKAVETLKEALRTDENYRHSWKSNIAMSIHDTYFSRGRQCLEGQELHDVFNESADNFLKQLCQ